MFEHDGMNDVRREDEDQQEATEAGTVEEEAAAEDTAAADTPAEDLAAEDLFTSDPDDPAAALATGPSGSTPVGHPRHQPERTRSERPGRCYADGGGLLSV